MTERVKTGLAGLCLAAIAAIIGLVLHGTVVGGVLFFFAGALAVVGLWRIGTELRGPRE